MDATTRILLVTAGTPVVWGSTYLVTTELLPDGRPLLAGALRALPAGLLLLAVTRELPTGAWWWRSAALGILNIGAFFALLFVSAYRLPGGVAAVLGAVGPMLVAALSVLLLGERLSARRLLAGVTAAAGVGLTVVTAAAGLDPVGVVAGIAGALSMSLGIVLTKRWPRPTSVLTMTGWQLSAGGLLLLPLAVAVEGLPASMSATNVAGYAYLSVVGSALAYAVWFRGIDQLPAFSVSLLGQLSPLVATLLGWSVLSQRLTPLQLLGMAVALGGVVAGSAPQRDVHRRQRPRPARRTDRRDGGGRRVRRGDEALQRPRAGHGSSAAERRGGRCVGGAAVPGDRPPAGASDVLSQGRPSICG